MVSEKRKKQIDNFLQSINMTCDNYEMLDLSLTHGSYTFENDLPSLENNERLEFFGDAVLKLISSHYLLERFPSYAEGELTKIRSVLVSDNTLSGFARKIELSKVLKLGYHEEKMGGRDRSSTLACAFEALLGAFYLDGKEPMLRSFLINLLTDEVTEIDKCASKSNFKALLQEYTQAQAKSLPVYILVNEQGPAHNKTFNVEVIFNDTIIGIGSGKTKKDAQQKAAEDAVLKLGLI